MKRTLCQIVVSVMQRKKVMERVYRGGGVGCHHATSEGGDGVGHENKPGEEHLSKREEKMQRP